MTNYACGSCGSYRFSISTMSGSACVTCIACAHSSGVAPSLVRAWELVTQQPLNQSASFMEKLEHNLRSERVDKAKAAEDEDEEC